MFDWISIHGEGPSYSLMCFAYISLQNLVSQYPCSGLVVHVLLSTLFGCLYIFLWKFELNIYAMHYLSVWILIFQIGSLIVLFWCPWECSDMGFIKFFIYLHDLCFFSFDLISSVVVTSCLWSKPKSRHMLNERDCIFFSFVINSSALNALLCYYQK